MDHMLSAKSLQSLCLDQSAVSLDHYSPELLSRIPPPLRHQLLLQSPIVDVCRYEKTCAFDKVNADKLWGEIYDKHWKCYYTWHFDSTVTTKTLEMVDGFATTNREKYFILLTTIIFNADRPTGYFGSMTSNQTRIEHEPKGVATGYPCDIINYLAAADVSSLAGIEVTNDSDVDDMDGHSESWYPDDDFPLSHCDLDDTQGGVQLSSNYSRIAAVNQRIPQCYASLAQSDGRISDEDAISLMMEKCNYYPKIAPVGVTDFKLWSWKQEDLEQLLVKFFRDITAIHLSIIKEPGETSSLVVSTCFNNRIVPCTLYLNLFHRLDGLHYLHSMISQLTLEKLHIYSPFDFDLADNLCKELGEILSRQKGNIREIKLHECSFPEEFNFLLSVTAVIQSPTFAKFDFHCYSESPEIVQLLNAFFSTPSSHSQQLIFGAGCTIDFESTVRDSLRPMPFSVCDSSLQHKSLTLKGCSARLCSWLLRLQPLSLQSIHFQFVPRYNKVFEEVHDVLESVAHNEKLRMCNLTLVGHGFDWSDVQAPLPEDSLISIFKRPLLKSLTLDLKCGTSSLASITNALHVQTQLGTLKKLKISFSLRKILKETCDVELLLEAVFNLPQISKFSFDIDILLHDLTIVEIIYKFWRSSKKPKELRFGHFHDVTIPGNVQSLLDEMQLAVVKEACVVISGTLCETLAEHSMICTQNLI